MRGMRRVISAALCAATLLAVAGPASAAPNGQLVAVELRSPNALSTFNADGSGFHRLWEAPADAHLASTAWSPDGNSLAFVQDGRIKVLPAAGGTPVDLGAGIDPGWTPDGSAVAFRRGQDLLAVPAAGGAERNLGHLPDDGTTDLAWSPDGWIARSAFGGLRVDALDGAGEDVLANNSAGRLDWSPDGGLVAYAAAGLYVHYVRVVSLDGDSEAVTSPPDFYARDVDPSWSPDGERIVYLRTNVSGGDQLRVVGSGGDDTLIPTPYGASWTDPDWQPCVAGVTTSCTSVTPPQAGPAYRCANPSISVRSGQQRDVPFNCTTSGQAVRLGSRPTDMAILTQPAHGTAWIEGQRMLYRAAAGYVGADTFSVRAASGSMTSNDITVTVNVTPTLAALAAPKLTVLGKPKLDKHGRVVLRGTCTNVCDVALRVIVRLNTQRVLKGRIVKASAMPGATVRLRLQRAKLPKHRRIVSARISGTLSTRTVTGALLQRNFTLSLIP
jgi:hypothetical protein